MTHNTYRAEKIMEKINGLASISEDASCITRTYCTEAFIHGRKKVVEWMNDIGLTTYIDNIGNVRGTWRSEKPDAKTFVIGSHIDTVVNAGKFDGPLGVLLGMDIIEQLRLTYPTIPFNVELIAFSDEEGVRFHTTYLGSRVVAGNYDISMLDKKDSSGITLKDVIREIGGDIEKLGSDLIPRDKWLGYFEAHIEQGPVLYEKDIPVAVVTSIAGQKRIEMKFTGVAGHAGTVPMDMRFDALCAAAEIVLAIEHFALGHRDQIVATVGKIDIQHSASNVIPGKVSCTLDLRSADETQLSTAFELIKNLCTNICGKRGVGFNWSLIQESVPVNCDADLSGLLASAITESGYQVVKLVSGAGHDGVPISEVAPITMLFIRCYKGISHNPLENVELKDIAAAIKVSDNFMHQLIKSNQ